MTYVFYRGASLSGGITCDSQAARPVSHGRLAIHSPGITFALPVAPPASACPSPDRPGSVRAAEVAGSSLFPLEWLLGWSEASRAKRCLGSGPLPASRVSAAHPNPAWRPKQSSLWPLFLQPCTRPSRGTPRRLTVVPLIRIRGTTVSLRWGYGGMSGR
jgi:hypothetical protein